MNQFFFMRERQQASLTRRQLLLGTAVIALSVSAGFRVPPQERIISFVIVNGWVLKAADVRSR